MENPFVIKSYKSKELFCDREKELETLIRNFENDTDTTIVSLRRMGKTGLIYRFFDEIKIKSLDILPVYVDIYASRTIADFIKLTAEAVLNQSRELVIQALLVDSVNDKCRCIPELVDLMISRQSPYLDYLK